MWLACICCIYVLSLFISHSCGGQVLRFDIKWFFLEYSYVMVSALKGSGVKDLLQFFDGPGMLISIFFSSMQ
jgi:hypothetical protein